MILRSNSLQIPLRDKSVHCVVTSPPYWSLRDYAVNGQLGLEKTPEEYVEKMAMVFREVWRVMKPEATLWLNMGDSYNAAGRNGHGTRIGCKQMTNRASACGDDHNRSTSPGLKPKDLCGIPWRLAFALQADGWYLRSDIIWAKPNPMPESVTDRPTKSHEYVFLLSKQPSYFFDQEAVREKSITGDPRRPYTSEGAWQMDGRPKEQRHGGEVRIGCRKELRSGIESRHRCAIDGGQSMQAEPNGGRNIRTVWNIATQPFPESHFATFPEELARRCILAGTSEKGVCPKCGGPWVRVLETQKAISKTCPKEQASHEARGGTGEHTGTVGKSGSGRIDGYTKTLGWKPSCKCGLDPVPAVVLDPFAGSGTVGIVCAKYRRNFIGLDLKAEYCQMAKKRIYEQPPTMI